MKTMAFEFTLTALALGLKGQESNESLRCRVILRGDEASTVARWRAKNVLGEDVWLGGNSEDWIPTIGGVHVSKESIVWWGMRTLAERVNRDRCLEVKELPNGAIVFDLGMV